MKACIYTRTCHGDKSHNRMTLDNQITFCRRLALEHNLTVSHEHVFTDVDADGSVPPVCWAREGEVGRPALAAMIAAIENHEVARVIVARVERLATSSILISALVELCEYHDVNVVASPEQTLESDDAGERFAASSFGARLEVDTDLQREAKAKAKAKKSEEIKRLQEKIERLEAEIAEL